jgi:hypothetical protein
MSGSQLLGVDLARIDTAASFPVGQPHVTEDGRHLRYMQADGAVTPYLLQSYRPLTWQVEDEIDLAVTPATGETVAMCIWDGSSTTVPDNSFAWFFVGPGTFTGTSAEAITVDVTLYGHATNGTLSDTASACMLAGVVCPVAIGSATTGTFYASVPMYAIDLV